ncbi:MAG: metallophosphoesterase family protein [Myxococcales bacterium]|nr:metallophosphoesterase family protein [Myxococcales bacterium]
MRLAWATDIHLDFLEPTGVHAFGDALAGSGADAAVLTGDLTIAPRLAADLSMLEDRARVPLYFVLGNHDFYRGSVTKTHVAARSLTRSARYLRWLPESGVVALGEKTALIGCDGWGDARLGNVAGTPVRLNDFMLIEDLCGLGRRALTRMLQGLGDDEGRRARALLQGALARFERVVFATHVPPFRESCWHEGKTPAEDDDWLPFFTCKAVGDALLEAADAHPDRYILVLCGHTHGAGVAQLRHNLVVRTGHAEYAAPRVQEVFEFA